MSDIVIRAESLSKRYRIGEREQYGVLRDVLARAASAPFRMFRPRKPESANGDATHIWALKDVSFDIRQGEVVGIIGRNGAGKSTLLKILARVTKPTTGHAEVRGRIGSMLEVGTGFHFELTGRENTYLNGAILGMKKAEIDRKFDNIVDFAEIENFIDTPVKHYSSGMAVRLAFAVAAHLEPEILLIDEVLSVGDIAFQDKCLRKIRQLTQQGITSVFVSHNLHLIEVIGQQCLYFDAGSVHFFDRPSAAIQQYLRDSQTQPDAPPPSADTPRPEGGNGRTDFAISRLTASGGSGRSELHPGQDLVVTIDYKSSNAAGPIHFSVSIFSEKLLPVTTADTRVAERGGLKPSGDGTMVCRFPSPALVAGKYSVRANILSEANSPLASFGWDDGRLCAFSVAPVAQSLVTGMQWVMTQSDFGVIRMPYEWSRPPDPSAHS